jgi:hypothetical protein
VGSLALGLASFAAPQVAGPLALASFVVAAVGSWVAVATLKGTRRGLHLRIAEMRRVEDCEFEPKVWTSEGQSALRSGNALVVTVRMTLRGGSAIAPDQFHEGGDLLVDIGVPIAEVLSSRPKPRNEVLPDSRVTKGRLAIRPASINPGTELDFIVLTASAAGLRLTCAKSVIRDVQVHVHGASARGAIRLRGIYLLALVGAAIFCADLVVPHLVPGLAARLAFRLGAIILDGMVAGGLVVRAAGLIWRGSPSEQPEARSDSDMASRVPKS